MHTDLPQSHWSWWVMKSIWGTVHLRHSTNSTPFSPEFSINGEIRKKNKADGEQTITLVTINGYCEWGLFWGKVGFLIVNPRIIQNYPPRYRPGWAGAGSSAGQILPLENSRAGGARPVCYFPRWAQSKQKRTKLHILFQIHQTRLLLGMWIKKSGVYQGINDIFMTLRHPKKKQRLSFHLFKSTFVFLRMV